MLRTASSLPHTGLSTLGSDPARFPAEPPACYRASCQLPGPDFHRQATTSLRTRRTPWHYVTVSPPVLLGARDHLNEPSIGLRDHNTPVGHKHLRPLVLGLVPLACIEFPEFLSNINNLKPRDSHPLITIFFGQLRLELRNEPID